MADKEGKKRKNFYEKPNAILAMPAYFMKSKTPYRMSQKLQKTLKISTDIH